MASVVITGAFDLCQEGQQSFWQGES